MEIRRSHQPKPLTQEMEGDLDKKAEEIRKKAMRKRS
jgi:hypothetical protein